MKITKAQLKQIIKEETEDRIDEVGFGGFLAGVDQDDPKFKAWQAKQKSPGIERPPSLEARVTRLERKLDDILQSLGGTQSGETQVELEEQK
tara:strand:- start:52 stop:327 length:276 start_codon:yes stop_codon:yes gene_type:complete